MPFELPIPKVQVRERSIIARYDTGKHTEPTKYQAAKKILFTFEVHYSKAGPNYYNGTYTKTDYFGVSVVNETLDESHGHEIIGFVMGSGLGLKKIEQPSNRFSKKKLKQIFDDEREYIEGIFSVDEELLDDSQKTLLAHLAPYLSGQKAGLA